MRQHHGTVALTGIHIECQGIATAEDVFLAKSGGKQDFVGRPVANTQVDEAGRSFLDLDIDVDLVGATRHRRGADIDFVEITQAVDAIPGGTNTPGIVPGSFLLPEFSTYDFVSGTGVTADLYAPDVKPATGVNIERQIRLTAVAI